LNYYTSIKLKTQINYKSKSQINLNLNN